MNIKEVGVGSVEIVSGQKHLLENDSSTQFLDAAQTVPQSINESEVVFIKGVSLGRDMSTFTEINVMRFAD